LVDFKQGKKPEPYFNRYRNSVYFMDSLIADLETHLKATGQWDNTLLIVTSDHGEEFADTQPTRFGHGSNYARYQTQVPLFMHWPGKAPKKFNHRTASIDLVPTLMQSWINCENPIGDYSNGENLFVEQDRAVQVMASYYNYAFVTSEGSFTQNPVGLLDARNREDKSDSDLSLDPAAAVEALEQMKHFYKTAK
jgi:membrane-anchored protein YejM (alkaline phosphatase superfamily)